MPNPKALEANIKKMMQKETDAMYRALRLLQMRELIEHRGFTIKQLSDRASRSKEWVRLYLRASPKIQRTFHEGFDILDDAVDSLTRERGYMCRCDEHVLQSLRDILGEDVSTKRLLREEFKRGW